MNPTGSIKKKGGRVVVETKDGEFEVAIPFEEIRELLNDGYMKWKLGKYIHENGDEYVFTSFEEFSRAAVVANNVLGIAVGVTPLAGFVFG